MCGIWVMGKFLCSLRSIELSPIGNVVVLPLPKKITKE
jgi:hypothetical protein